MALTDVRIRSLKSVSKPQRVSDGEGLFIQINPSGSKLWRLAYRFGRKQKLLALGAYPQVSLREARRRRDAARDLLEQGRDPSEERKSERRRAQLIAENTFGAVANEWFERQKAVWALTYSDRLRSRLDADLMPALGARPLLLIEPADVLSAVRMIEQRNAPEMARRILQMAGAIFRYGVATGRCARDPTADLKGALIGTPSPKSRSALSAGELPEFFERLRNYDGEPTTALAINLVVLTFVRSAELRFARWAEFEDLDGETPLWRIPADRMKMRRAHLVPLAPQSVRLLKSLQQQSSSSPYLFAGARRDAVMSENTMIFALYRMGYHGRATVHGFRTTASTILNEQGFNRDWIEMQLAHADGTVRGIYNAAEWLVGRRNMMEWWATYLDRAQRMNGLRRVV